MANTLQQFLESGGFLALENPALDPIDVDLLVRQLPELDDHCLFRTSGTEGEPKFVALSRDALFASAKSVNERFGVGSEDRWLCALPKFHVGGFGIYARAHIAENEVVELQKWEPDVFNKTVVREAISMTSLVPTQLFDLVIRQLKAPETLRYAIIGGGALNPEIALRARALGWPIVETYGMTETGSMVAATSDCESGKEGRLKFLDGWEGINDDDSLTLKLRGEGLFAGYVSQSDGVFEFDSPKDADGWFTTSDRVEVDSGGLRFIGRLGAEVKVLGELVDLDRLQQRVSSEAESLGVDPNHLIVVALADERSGNRIVLADASGSNDGQSVVDHVNVGLAGYERITEALPVVEIPRGSLGKPLRRKLRLLLERQL